MRVAVLGCGSIGRRHLRNLIALDRGEVLGFDPDPATREIVRREMGIDPLADVTDIWRERPDVALVAAPSHLHVPLALAAAEHGCHLFIEKPLSHSLDRLDELESLAAARGLITMVGCNMRFHPGPAAVKRLLDECAIGRVLAARVQTGSYLPGWRPWLPYTESYSADPARGGGAVLDCIHEIDLALWYFGAGHLAGSVVRPASSLGLEVDGLAELLIEHVSGVVSSVHLNFVQRDYRRTCQVIGDAGTIYWDFEAPAVRVLDGVSERRIDLAADGATDRMYVDELKHFVGAVERGEETACPIRDGRAALEVALAARSHRRSDRMTERSHA